MEVPGSTLEGLHDRESRLSVWGRRSVLIVIALVVATGLTGNLGLHTRTETVTAGGYTLSLDYGWVARPGLDTPWQVTLVSETGFDDPITLEVTADYFDIYETQGFFPEPDGMVRDASRLRMTFAAPEGDTFVLFYDAYVQPSSQRGRDGVLSVIDGGHVAASLDFTTHLLP